MWGAESGQKTTNQRKEIYLKDPVPVLEDENIEDAVLGALFSWREALWLC